MGSGRGEGSHLPTRELSLSCLALSGFWGGLVGSWSCSSQVGGVGGLLGAAQTPQVFLSLFGWGRYRCLHPSPGLSIPDLGWLL